MIRMRHLCKEYNHGKENSYQALRDVTLEIGTGELAAVMGKSGAGKSTLLHIMACMDSFYEGEYELDGRPVRDCQETELAAIRNRKIGIVMQDFALMEDCSALDNVLLPLDISGGIRRKERNERAMGLLKEVGLEKLWDHEVRTLSGGEKQRVAIARALVNHPVLILADEPTGALDSVSAQEIMDLLKRLNKQGITVVIVTHDPQIAEQCGRVITIQDGKVSF